MLQVPIIVEESAGIARKNEPVTLGIPFPKGVLTRPDRLALWDPTLGRVPLQAQTLATWSDQSLKWVLLDFQTSVGANETRELELRVDGEEVAAVGSPRVTISESDGELRVDTGAARFTVNTRVFRPFDHVVIGGQDLLAPPGGSTVLTDDEGREHEPLIRTVVRETEGPLRSTLCLEGEFACAGRKPLARFIARLSFFSGSALTKIDFTIWNPRAAEHRGGFWDLGDPGSIFFEDLSLRLNTAAGPDARTLWSSNQGSVFTEAAGGVVIYQDSSGGENWRSSAHVNRFGEVKTSFRGYKVTSGDDTLEWGFRAEPQLALVGGGRSVWAVVPRFWQNFPKVLEAHGSEIGVRLFPRQFDDVFELQGGERKTHTVYLDFRATEAQEGLACTHAPLIPRSTPEWYGTSGAVPYLVLDEDIPHRELVELVRTAVDGNNTFSHRREVIDEFGWRNFGELYADHEAVLDQEATPLVSHYNNQYDAIYGFLVQFLRTCKEDWFVLGRDLCAHVCDIDVYHTDQDRPQYNHGLFWHTDHYKPAKTSTHRCFSRQNVGSREEDGYGGGPSLAHCYSSGLLLYHYLSGDYSARETVQELVDFQLSNLEMASTLVCRAHNFAKRMLLALRPQPSVGLVRVEKVFGLNGPGRSSGNALGVLLDGHALACGPECILAAEMLIRRCISPRDTIGAMDLLDIENRWMYTVFLQALEKYIRQKEDSDDRDWMWWYAVCSLVRYAKWMAENESNYLDSPERLEYPTETWAVQDFRKAAVMIAASRYAPPFVREEILTRAQNIEEKARQQLLSYASAILTRPMVVLLQNYHRLYGAYHEVRTPTWSCCSSKMIPPGRGIGNCLREALVRVVSSCSVSVVAEIKYIASALGKCGINN